MPIYASGVRPSMGSVGDAYDNAMAESFFLTLEAELLSRRRRFTSQTEARMACFSDIEGWYNPPGRTRAWATGRLRSHTGGRSGPGVARKPDQAERQAWRNPSTERGEDQTARRLGLSRNTIYHALSGGPALRG